MQLVGSALNEVAHAARVPAAWHADSSSPNETVEICCYVKRILIDEYSANARGREHAYQFFEIVIRTVFSVLFRL